MPKYGSPARIRTPVSCVQGRRDNNYTTGERPRDVIRISCDISSAVTPTNSIPAQAQPSTRYSSDHLLLRHLSACPGKSDQRRIKSPLTRS